MANTSTFTDALNGTALNGANWNAPLTNTNTSITPTVNGIVFANASGTTAGQASGLASASQAWTFDSISFELTNVTSPANSGFFLNILDTANNAIKLTFVIDSGTLFCQVDGTNEFSVAFNAINHKWLLIFTTGSNAVFSASQDGVSWVTLFTYSTSDPLSGLNCYIQFGTYVDATLTTGSSFTVSNLNVGPLSPPAVNDWQAGNGIQPAVNTTPGDLDVYASQAFNFLAKPPLLRATQANVQSFAASQAVVVSFDTIEEINNCTFISNVFTATQPGWYSVTFTVEADPPSQTFCQLGLQYNINGAVTGPWLFCSSFSGSTAIWAWNCYQEIYLNAGDTVTPYFLNNAAAAFNSNVNPDNPPYPGSSALEIAWISE